MKIDPNFSVDSRRECVLCSSGLVELHNGSTSSLEALLVQNNPFQDFCRSLDPNKCYITAYITSDADREVFFRAREVAETFGIHMQSTVETPERASSQWAIYKETKQNTQSKTSDLTSSKGDE